MMAATHGGALETAPSNDILAGLEKSRLGSNALITVNLPGETGV